MRWTKLFFTQFFCIALFYYYFLSPIKSEISSYVKEEKQLKKMLWKKQNTNTSNKRTKNIYLASELPANYLFRTFASSQFLITEVYPTQIQKRQSSFKLHLSGGIVEFKKMVDQIHHEERLINIDEVAIDQNKTVMKLGVFNVSNRLSHTEVKDSQAFQWIGCVGDKTALLRSYSGDILEVAEGFYIKKTMIKILKIAKEKMYLQQDHDMQVVKYGELFEG